MRPINFQGNQKLLHYLIGYKFYPIRYISSTQSNAIMFFSKSFKVWKYLKKIEILLSLYLCIVQANYNGTSLAFLNNYWSDT